MYAHGSHIPQPPHSAGAKFQGFRANINQNQIPSPVDAIEFDKVEWENKTFMTLPGNHVPLSTTDFVAIDQGNSSPKYVRVSTWNFPSSSQLATECEIPLAAIFQPFATLDAQEEDIPVVDHGETGPPRCAKCRGYINSWCRFVSGGSKWQCNLCGHETEVSTEFFCNLDANLMRLDHLQRPELNKGTVDFVVPEAYWANPPPISLTPSYYSVDGPSTTPRKPQSMNYMFILDVSMEAVQSGFLRTSCNSIRKSLYGWSADDGVEREPCIPRESHVGILAFDSALYFYNLSSYLDRAAMLVVSDIDEVFLPIHEGLFVEPQESRAVIEKLLQALPERYEGNLHRDSALGSAIRAGLAGLAGRGGQMIIFQSILPTIGPGALETRVDETVLYDTDKEKELYLPSDKAWQDIGEECAEEGIGVSMFLGNSKYVDVASIGAVCTITGGEIYFHPRFDHLHDSVVIESQLQRLLSRETVYNCMMRIRCSQGLRISAQYGNFYRRSTTDLEFGTLDADKAISVKLEHSRTLDDRQYAYLQCAVLHTTAFGQRRVRTCNLALQVASLVGNVFRYADMDATVCHLAREAISNRSSQKMAHIREDLTEKCSAILLGYRRNCAASTVPSQLILPEAFKALPAYVLAITKSKPLKGRTVSADVRNYYAHKLLSMSVRSTVRSLYPTLLALHDLEDDIALPNPATGILSWPTQMRDSHIYMSAHGLYLIDNGEIMIFWIGASISPQLLIDLFGTDDFMTLDPHMNHLPILDTRFSTQVRNILAYRNALRGRTPKILLARQNVDGNEIEFSDMLVEDQNNAALSYLDYLCLVHRQITTALNNGGFLTSGSGMRSPW